MGVGVDEKDIIRSLFLKVKSTAQLDLELCECNLPSIINDFNIWTQGSNPPFIFDSPLFEILLIMPQWNSLYITAIKLVKKVATTLPTLF